MVITSKAAKGSSKRRILGSEISARAIEIFFLCPPERKSALMSLIGSNSNLEINTEHSIDILIDFKSGVTANIHLDYVQSPPKRCTEIIGTNGRIEFDYYTNKLELYTRENPTAKEFIMDSFDRNDMFVDELNEFINAIKFKKPSPISLNDGFKSVNVAIKALNF